MSGIINLINLDRSLIPACDVPLDVFKRIAQVAEENNKVGGLKIGPALTGRPGYDRVVETARKHTEKPLIFDPQKWGTDIPDTAEKLLRPAKESGIDAVILFPQAGPVTQYEWTRTAQDLGLNVIIGGEMTHPRYLCRDNSNGNSGKDYTQLFFELGILSGTLNGYLKINAPDQIYILGALMGVRDFVVPGNKPEKIKYYRELITQNLKTGEPSFYSPGLITQGGDISEGAKAAGEQFHAIVGREIYQTEGRYKTLDEMREAVEGLVSRL